MNDDKIDSLLNRANNSKKIIWVSYKIDINKLKKLKKVMTIFYHQIKKFYLSQKKFILKALRCLFLHRHFID